MNLNLGAGATRYPNFVNVDLRPECADIVADVRRLPFPDESVHIIQAHDILEHLQPWEPERALAEWRRVLTHQGFLHLRVPNLLRLAEELVKTPVDDRGLIKHIYGGHAFGPDGEWDCHHTGWTPQMFRELLWKLGFTQHSEVLDYNINTTVCRARAR